MSERRDRDPAGGGEGGCGRYLRELAQRVLQHLHREDEGPLRQDLAVGISQVLPAGTGRGEGGGVRATQHCRAGPSPPARTPLDPQATPPICRAALRSLSWARSGRGQLSERPGSGFSPTNLCAPGPAEGPRPAPGTGQLNETGRRGDGTGSAGTHSQPDRVSCVSPGSSTPCTRRLSLGLVPRPPPRPAFSGRGSLVASEALLVPGLLSWRSPGTPALTCPVPRARQRPWCPRWGGRRRGRIRTPNSQEPALPA